jgi:hypothetical protein
MTLRREIAQKRVSHEAYLADDGTIHSSRPVSHFARKRSAVGDCAEAFMKNVGYAR